MARPRDPKKEYKSSQRELEYHRQYYYDNKEEALARMKKWREKNREKHLARARDYHSQNKERFAKMKREHRKENPEIYADRMRLKKYGMTGDEFRSLVAKQQGCCDACGKKRQLVVDHNHKTSAVRALLCTHCNTAIGLLHEDTDVMWRAIEYVVAHKRAAGMITA